MRECLGKHSCRSSPFPIAVLNGPSLFLSLVQEKLNMPIGHNYRLCSWSGRSNHLIKKNLHRVYYIAIPQWNLLLLIHNEKKTQLVRAQLVEYWLKRLLFSHSNWWLLWRGPAAAVLYSLSTSWCAYSCRLAYCRRASPGYPTCPQTFYSGPPRPCHSRVSWRVSSLILLDMNTLLQYKCLCSTYIAQPHELIHSFKYSG